MCEKDKKKVLPLAYANPVRIGTQIGVKVLLCAVESLNHFQVSFAHNTLNEHF
jgi:hypothetical protein